MSNDEGTRTPYDPYNPYKAANSLPDANNSYGVANSKNPPYSEADYRVANNLPETNNSYGVANSKNPPYSEADYRVANNLPETSNSYNLPESGFERGEFSPAAPGALGSKKKGRRSGPMQKFRDNQGNLCTKGGRVRCFGRICCCSLMTTVFLIVSIVLALVLFIRPPSIVIGSPVPLSGTGSIGDGISATSSGISLELGVDISVSNPNYFDVDFQEIKVEIFYPINNTPVGGGIATNIDFKSRSQTNFTFPFTLSYNNSEAESNAIFSDLANKCGVTGGTKSNLNINYKITLGIRILMAVISPVISNMFSFPCPITASEISQLLGGLKISS